MCIIDQDLHLLMNGFVHVHMQVLFICFVVSTLRPSPAVRRSASTFVERRESQRGTGIPTACCILLCNHHDSWFPRPRGGERGGPPASKCASELEELGALQQRSEEEETTTGWSDFSRKREREETGAATNPYQGARRRIHLCVPARSHSAAVRTAVTP
jgi:hypothetical protein